MSLQSNMALALVVAAGLAASHAQAAPLCKLTGSYSDDYGSTTSIKGKKGTILNTAVCPTAYSFKISNETQTGFTATGKNTTKSCGAFTAQLTFKGSCSVFSGSVTIHGSMLSDTFTKIQQSPASNAAEPSSLLDGLRE